MEELREVLSFRQGDDLSAELSNVGLHVRRNRGAFEVILAGNLSADVSISNGDHIANLQLETGNVDQLTVDHDVAVRNHLSSLENGSGIPESPNGGGESHLQKSKEVEAGVAAHSLRFLERVRELLLEHVVVAADDLLRQKLLAILGLASILKVRTMLPGWVRSLRNRLGRSAPNVKADGAANICFSSSVSRHKSACATSGTPTILQIYLMN